MCSGKYNIYFKIKITYPISTLPEHIHSTICTIDMDGGMCCIVSREQHNREQGHKTTQTHPWVVMPEPEPGGVLRTDRSSAQDRKVIT